MELSKMNTNTLISIVETPRETLADNAAPATPPWPAPKKPYVRPWVKPLGGLEGTGTGAVPGIEGGTQACSSVSASSN